MNKFKKNIILVGFREEEVNSINLPLIGNNYCFNNINEAFKHQGYLIIIKNNERLSFVDFDKKYRKKLKKYERIYIYDENINFKNVKSNKFSRIKYIERDYLFSPGLDFCLWDEYDLYKLKERKTIPLTNKKQNKICELLNFLSDKKIITTRELCNKLKMNDRMVQRYMNDINFLYDNIGYDYSKNEWYIL